MRRNFYNVLFLSIIIFLSGSYSFSADFTNPVSVINIADQNVTFSVSLEDSKAVINWKSTPEVESILIERSTDNRRFEPLFQSFKNNTQTRFVDDFSGQSMRSNQVFYRLVVQFKDGSSKTTSSKSLYLSSGGNFKPNVFVNGSEVSFQFNSDGNNIAYVRIFNSSTGLVKELDLRTTRGDNMQHVSLYGVKSGMYFLQIEQGGKRATTKFFIQ